MYAECTEKKGEENGDCFVFHGSILWFENNFGLSTKGYQLKAKKINGSLVLKERFGYNYRPSENKTEVRVRVHNSERIEADEEMNHSSLSLTETEFRRV